MRQILHQIASKQMPPARLMAVGLLLGLLWPSWIIVKRFMQLDDFSLSNLALLFIPFIIRVSQPQQTSNRYVFWALLAFVFYAWIGGNFFLFLALSFTIFWIIEHHWGKLNLLAPAAVLAVTPLIRYGIDTMGFPLRLQLTQAASGVLSLLGIANQVSGNAIQLGGEVFTVEAACMGLKMVITSVLLSFLFLSFHERKTKSEVTLLGLTLSSVTTLALVILCNLSRIVLLILTRSGVESTAHQLIGLACLLVWVVIPLYFFVPLLFQIPAASKNGTSPTTISRFFPPFVPRFVMALAALLLGWLSFSKTEISNEQAVLAAMDLEIPGYSRSVVFDNILQFKSNKAIVYVKPLQDAFEKAHHPLHCWIGSGYRVAEEQIMEVGDQQVCFARIKQGHRQLYTTWWYENDQERTISAMSWRVKHLKGAAPFRLVNVASESIDIVLEETHFMLD